MSQTTFNGSITPVKVLQTTLTPTQTKILNCIRHSDRGLTHDQIRDRMRLSGISRFDNRLRELRAAGYVVSYPAPDGTLLWFSKEAIDDE